MKEGVNYNVTQPSFLPSGRRETLPPLLKMEDINMRQATRLRVSTVCVVECRVTICIHVCISLYRNKCRRSKLS